MNKPNHQHTAESHNPVQPEKNAPGAAGRHIRIKCTSFLKTVLPLMAVILLLQTACKKKETENIPSVTITGISKNLLNIGDTLIINGSHFDSTPSKNLVSVASVAFTVIKASEGQLAVVVPKGAQSGSLSVGFAQGQSVSFAQQITIVGSGQPFIISITPAAAFENDTITIRGGNFSPVYTLNSITFNGKTSGKIVNATENELKAVIPDLSDSGPVQVTTNGLNSLPMQFTVSKVDPFLDGNIYWMMPVYTFSNETFSDKWTSTLFIKGNSNNALPQSSIAYQLNQALFQPYNVPFSSSPFYPEIPSSAIDNVVVNDSRGNAYYLANNAYPFPSEYSLMKFSGSGAPAPVWSKNFPAPGKYTTFYGVPSDTIDYPPVAIHYSPVQQIAIDGNTVYIKLGITDDYYVGDLSPASPTLTLKTHVFGDSLGYHQQFGKDYIFYSRIGSSGFDANPGSLTGLRYMQRGSKVSQEIPLVLRPYQDNIVNTLADPSHGNNLLIVLASIDDLNVPYTVIYKFNADTKKLTLLYDRSNWADASTGRPYSGFINSGFIWLGTHIYYANFKNTNLYTGLHRINDSGISPKIYTVYGRMEPLSLNRAPYFSLYTLK